MVGRFNPFFRNGAIYFYWDRGLLWFHLILAIPFELG